MIYIYRPPHLLYSSSHDIVCQLYIVPCTSSACTVTVCRVITYAPSRASFPKPQFQSYFTPGGILTLIPSQSRPSKISIKANTKFQANLSVSSEFISSRLQGDTLRAIFLDLSIRPSFLGRHAGRVPCGPCSSCLDYSVRLWVTDLDSLSLSLSLRL